VGKTVDCDIGLVLMLRGSLRVPDHPPYFWREFPCGSVGRVEDRPCLRDGGGQKRDPPSVLEVDRTHEPAATFRGPYIPWAVDGPSPKNPIIPRHPLGSNFDPASDHPRLHPGREQGEPKDYRKNADRDPERLDRPAPFEAGPISEYRNRENGGQDQCNVASGKPGPPAWDGLPAGAVPNEHCRTRHRGRARRCSQGKGLIPARPARYTAPRDLESGRVDGRRFRRNGFGVAGARRAHRDHRRGANAEAEGRSGPSEVRGRALMMVARAADTAARPSCSDRTVAARSR
jgi:hypothetical protein